MRFEKPKNAAIAAMSQMSFSEKPAAASSAISASLAAKPRSFTREANVRIVRRRGVSSAVRQLMAI